MPWEEFSGQCQCSCPLMHRPRLHTPHLARELPHRRVERIPLARRPLVREYLPYPVHLSPLGGPLLLGHVAHEGHDVVHLVLPHLHRELAVIDLRLIRELDIVGDEERDAARHDGLVEAEGPGGPPQGVEAEHAVGHLLVVAPPIAVLLLGVVDDVRDVRKQLLQPRAEAARVGRPLAVVDRSAEVCEVLARLPLPLHERGALGGLVEHGVRLHPRHHHVLPRVEVVRLAVPLGGQVHRQLDVLAPVVEDRGAAGALRGTG
mmetsp:Transcript_45925/g.146610  ORF Transcript_45925/g.146610 Transcript_45925/m.146610 type:complete len:261 (-) Transcript_45925:289-1071(-)